MSCAAGEMDESLESMGGFAQNLSPQESSNSMNQEETEDADRQWAQSGKS
jgi:hypothetical protein